MSVPSLSPRPMVVRFNSDDLVERTNVQFHIDSACGLPKNKSSNETPVTYIKMFVDEVGTPRPYETERARNKGDPVWHENIGPMLLKPTTNISFQVRHRTKLLKTRTIASTSSYTLEELVNKQGTIYGRDTSLVLPLELPNTTDTAGSLTISIRGIATLSTPLKTSAGEFLPPTSLWIPRSPSSPSSAASSERPSEDSSIPATPSCDVPEITIRERNSNVDDMLAATSPVQLKLPMQEVVIRVEEY